MSGLLRQIALLVPLVVGVNLIADGHYWGGAVLGLFVAVLHYTRGGA